MTCVIYDVSACEGFLKDAVKGENNEQQQSVSIVRLRPTNQRARAGSSYLNSILADTTKAIPPAAMLRSHCEIRAVHTRTTDRVNVANIRAYFPVQ